MNVNNFNKASNTVLTLRDKKQKQLVLLDHYIRSEENIGRMKFPELKLGEFYFSLSQASEYLETHKEQVRRLMNELEKLGVITTIELSNSKRKPSKYRYNTYSGYVTVKASDTKGLSGDGVTVNVTDENVTVNVTDSVTDDVTVKASDTKGLGGDGVTVNVTDSVTVNVTSKKELLKRITKKNSLKDITTTNNKEEEKVVVEILNTQFAKCFNREVLPKYVEDLMGYMSKGITLELVLKIMEYSMSKNDPMAYCRRVIENSVSVCVYTVDAFEEKIKERAKLKVAQQPVPKNTRFTKIMSHNWDLNELERLEQEYIDKKLHGSGVADDKSF